MSKEVLIIGAGPAGASAAIFAQKAGWRATIIERETKEVASSATAFKIGESLPPKSRFLLEQLSVYEDFLAIGPLEAAGNQSYWGEDVVQYNDFIKHAEGAGWHIDRLAFEDLLLEHAQRRGATLIAGANIEQAEHRPAHWIVQYQDQSRQHHTGHFQYIIDASGQNSWFARQQRINRIHEDQQLALVALHEIHASTVSSMSLIESTEDGWWYSAKIPGNRLVTALLCSPDPSVRKHWTNWEMWKTLLRKAPHTMERLASVPTDIFTAPPRFVSANSGILEKTFGHRWLAIGDAATSYDPVASHGILNGMITARDAIQALIWLEKGDQLALQRYNDTLWHYYLQYTQLRKQYYNAERRFPQSTYWKQRQSTP